VEASSDEVEAQEASLRDLGVSLIAEVARKLLPIAGLQNQLAVAKKNAENQTETLKITQVRLDSGRGTELDTSRAIAQLDSTRAIIPPLQSAIYRAIHRLGVLTGQRPDALIKKLEQPAPMPRIPETIQIGNPADLLRRRQDIRIAERTLAAATARIGVATADLFPARHLCRYYRTRGQLPVGSRRIGFRRLCCGSEDQLGSPGSWPCLCPY